MRTEQAIEAVATDMVTIPRAELDATKAELRRLRLAEGRAIALARSVVRG